MRVRGMAATVFALGPMVIRITDSRLERVMQQPHDREAAKKRAVRLESSQHSAIRRLLDDYGCEALEDADLDDWNRADLEALRRILGEEQFQALVDEIVEGGSHER